MHEHGERLELSTLSAGPPREVPSVPSERPHGALVPASEAAEQLGGVLASRRGRPRVQALHYAAAAAFWGGLLSHVVP